MQNENASLVAKASELRDKREDSLGEEYSEMERENRRYTACRNVFRLQHFCTILCAPLMPVKRKAGNIFKIKTVPSETAPVLNHVINRPRMAAVLLGSYQINPRGTLLALLQMTDATRSPLPHLSPVRIDPPRNRFGHNNSAASRGPPSHSSDVSQQLQVADHYCASPDIADVSGIQTAVTPQVMEMTKPLGQLHD
ncbi:hypothetical protein NQZ68_016658 [Dissostichus eleginoides]|nr:hypothetical protein NQZ68_016658 [Dissostichus eleginoides]